MRTFTLRLVFALITLGLLGFAGAAGAEDGNGSGGGGSSLRRGSYWRVADAAYQAPKYTKFRIDDALNAKFNEIKAVLGQLQLPFAQFFAQEVYGPNVEYRLVEQLPKNCHFVDESDVHGDTQETNVHIGCTFGSITYLLKPAIEEALETKNYLELALLIIHERLFPFAKNLQSYEVISEYVQGVRLLMVRYAPLYQKYLLGQKFDPKAEWVVNPPRVFSNEELEVVNQLPQRMLQLGATEPYLGFYDINAYGGLSRGVKMDPSTKLGLGARMERGEIVGKGNVVVASAVQGLFLEGDDIRLVGVFADSHVTGSITGRNISFVNSNIKDISLTAHDFTVVDTQWDGYAALNVRGRNVQVRNSVVGNPHWSCNEKNEGKFDNVNTWFVRLFQPDGLVLDGKTIDSGCKVLDQPNHPKP